jgi:hypothetical protein
VKMPSLRLRAEWGGKIDRHLFDNPDSRPMFISIQE